MAYSVKEIYYTLQGEGAQSGMPAVFLRFSGCNLWSGREADRAAAICNFCDTDFLHTDGPGGGQFHSAIALAEAVQQAWPAFAHHAQPWVVCTGGEPLLQLDDAAIAALHAVNFRIAVETNGTLPAPRGIDWLTVSPKAGTQLVVRTGEEFKLVHPQPNLDPQEYISLPFQYFFLQPLAGSQLAENQRLAVEYCLQHPPWRLSLQIHKLLGLR